MLVRPCANLLAQGYVPVMGQDGQTVYPGSSRPLPFAAGVAITF